MGNRQVRIGQIIAPFGPGSIYTDRRGVPLVVAGLDYWFKREDAADGSMVQCEDRTEFERIEPRLSALLHVDRFCLPPDYRSVRREAKAPPNALLNVPALRFPRWYRHTKTGKLQRFNLHTTRVEKPRDGGRWQPVRFISVCAGGHLGEFPWQQWIGCSCTDGGDIYLTDLGGSELSSIRVQCKSCPGGSDGSKGRNLAGTTKVPPEGEQSAFQRVGIGCPGDRPWLGEGATEAGCKNALVGALINQTNLYFPRTISAITLPDIKSRDDSTAELRSMIEKYAGSLMLGVSLTMWRMGSDAQADVAADVQRKLRRLGVDATEQAILTVLKGLFEGSGAAIPAGITPPSQPESDLLAFRRAEFNILRNEINEPKSVPNLRVIAAGVPDVLDPWIARVNLVERLLETRVFYGFGRLKQDHQALADMPETAMRQLFRAPPVGPQDRWLPAVEVFGEGIYIELRDERLREWQQTQAKWLQSRVRDDFVNRLEGIFHTIPPLTGADRDWASRYLLVHTLAHLLISQLVFECGYSTASLRERLYVSADPAAPMAALLIYTAAGDSDGTLGGLVRLGRPGRLGAVVQRALSRASWCSADPVCSEHLGGTGSRLANLAACHACVLLPETSCETINQGLDRAIVVGTPNDRSPGFMSELADPTLTVSWS